MINKFLLNRTFLQCFMCLTVIFKFFLIIAELQDISLHLHGKMFTEFFYFHYNYKELEQNSYALNRGVIF